MGGSWGVWFIGKKGKEENNDKDTTKYGEIIY